MKPQLLYQKNPDLHQLQYPVYVAPKLDGIRALTTERGLVSRTLKSIPNRYIQEYAYNSFPIGFDGELIVGPPNSPTVYRDTNSAVMAHGGEPDFKYYVFDIWNSLLPYEKRLHTLNSYEERLSDRIILVDTFLCYDVEAVLAMEEQIVDKGYEGIIIRNPNAHYKFGRTTLKENNSFKLKRYEDSEAIIQGVIPEYANLNEAQINELGNIKRSIHQENLVQKDSMGSLLVNDPKFGLFNIGTGFNQEERSQLWSIRNELIGKVVKYKYFPVGMKDKPRHPVFLGFRDMEIDG